MAQPAFSTPVASVPTRPDYLGAPGESMNGNQQQLALLDMVFPGFSVLSTAVQRYTGMDLNLYIPAMILVGGSLFAWQYLSEYSYRKLDSYFMSKCSLRTDDEAYNYVMAWIAKQKFSLRSRRFIANTNTDARSFFTWKWRDDEDEENEYEGDEATRKPLSYTPDFGSHYFFYRGRLLVFHRSQNREQFGYSRDKEEISISCFGRSPAVLKELLIEARDLYLKRDEQKTSIYRGTTKGASAEPSWQRCMARTSRPFSTVILNEKVKKDLIDDVTDYLDPATRRWYSNRGIPYRRGYLLHGPPGTGKSSLSLALAGFFKMRIYIVSLSSMTANEETLATLFAELPRRCVVLLEDIDSAGLTHTRDDASAPVMAPAAAAGGGPDMVPGQIAPGRPMPAPIGGRLSLSGLLNILDGVASQEGRVLIMTTNHVEKLDKALIRPGRVDMTVHFGRADAEMTAAIFRAIYAPLEGDVEPLSTTAASPTSPVLSRASAEELAGVLAATHEKTAAEEKEQQEKARLRAEAGERVAALAEQFAAKIPAHEFSPAELQGFLMKNKRDPAAAVANAEDWVTATRKEKQQKELEEAEERRKQAEADAEEARKKKEEDEEKKKRKEKKEARRAKRKAAKKSKKKAAGGDGSDSDSSSDSSEDEAAGESKADAASPESKDSGYET
ncbi:hypothetical protein RB595_002413 [Gaeumannomyces hyphopodioides]